MLNPLTIDDDPKKVKDILARAMETAKEGLISILERLISEFKVTEMNIDFSIDEELKDYKSENTDVLYRICQEALTNAYRHAERFFHSCRIARYLTF